MHDYHATKKRRVLSQLALCVFYSQDYFASGTDYLIIVSASESYYNYGFVSINYVRTNFRS